jgi:hypothetical protein
MVYNGFSMRRRSLLSLLLMVGCASGGAQPGGQPSGGQPPSAVPVPVAVSPAPVTDGQPGAAVLHTAVVQQQQGEGDRLVRDDGTALTPYFKSIDSFDVSLERREVVFSAKRDSNFDVGLVSLDGSDVHWIPEDPADEVAVKWAPRGNKVSYVIRRASGDLIRTVHIPTAMQQIADFPYATVKAIDWDPSGERYSVTLTSPDASDQVVSLKYDGSGRQTVSPPKSKLDLSVEPFAGGVMLRPSLLRYNEQLPLVVWRSDKPLEWNEARGALLREHRIAIAVVPQMPQTMPDEAWIDRKHIILAPNGDVESIRQQLKDLDGRR